MTPRAHARVLLIWWPDSPQALRNNIGAISQLEFRVLSFPQLLGRRSSRLNSAVRKRKFPVFGNGVAI